MNFRNLKQTWIVAEIGVNHEGDEAVAADLIRKAAAAGADAVKFQTYTPANYVSTEQRERFDRVTRFCLGHDAFRRLSRVAEEAGVTFFSTPLHPADVDFLDGIAPLFKISSGDITHLELIRHAAAKGKPLIISTGAGTRDEIAAAVNAACAARPELAGNGELMLMHCVCAYPTPAEEANLRNIAWLQREFGLPVGYSDHTLGTKACELAVAAGAVALEKHFTYRKEDQAFHDHRLSADPQDLKQLVEAVRTAEVYLGSTERSRTASEAALLENMRRSLAVARDLEAGHVLSAGDVTWVRPAWGLAPDRLPTAIGKPLAQPLKQGTIIRPADLGLDQ